MNILLLNVTDTLHPKPHQGFTLKEPTFPPLGMLYMASMLEHAGHTPTILDYQFEPDPTQKIKTLLPTTDLIGMNVDNLCRDLQQRTAAEIKALDPSIPLAIGGPYCTVREQESMQFIPQADYCVVGEGEFAILGIMDALAGTRDPASIPGLIYRDHDHIHTGRPPEVITDLDALPFPARHLVPHYPYGKIGTTDMYQPPIATILTSRGCAYRCRFCIRHVLTYKKFRQRSAKNVVEEILHLNDHYKSLLIIDDNFLTDTARAHQIMDQLIAHDTTLDLIISGARADAADPRLFSKMKQAGVKHIQFGIETGTQKTLDFYNKKATLDQMTNAVQLAHQNDFFITASFILGAPIETKADLQATMNYACSLPLDIAIYNPLDYKYGSDLWLEANRQGLINNNEHNVFADSQRGIGNFTKEQLQRLCQQALIKFYFRPTYLYREIKKAVRTHNTRILKTWINYL